MSDSLFDARRQELEAAVQGAETALSEANERGEAVAIQRAETGLSNAVDRLDSYLYRGKRTSLFSLAPHPFWLDGGYDFESVQACDYHPDHKWITVRLGDVLQPHAYRDPDEKMVICQGCFAPRCGHSEDADPCLMWRHHETNHRYESGRIEPVGGWRS